MRMARHLAKAVVKMMTLAIGLIRSRSPPAGRNLLLEFRLLRNSRKMSRPWVAGSERPKPGAALRALESPNKCDGKFARQSSGGPDTAGVTGPPLDLMRDSPPIRSARGRNCPQHPARP